MSPHFSRVRLADFAPTKKRIGLDVNVDDGYNLLEVVFAMAVTRLANPITMTAEQVDAHYHGCWVAFHQPNIAAPGQVFAYGEDKQETQDSDYVELKLYMYNELGLSPMLVHGCRDRGRMDLRVGFHSDYPSDERCWQR